MSHGPFIPIAAPVLSERELEFITEAVRTSWVSSAGPFLRDFETGFASAIGVPRAEAVSNGTAALQVVLHAIGIGPGDEVIVPSQTFVSTAAAVVYCHATPVFADILADQWTLDTADVLKRLTPRTKAVIPVDLFGLCADIPGLRRALEQGGRGDVFILEDAAEAFGATLNGVSAGALGDAGIFSFYGNKTITTGEGGMVVTADAGLADRVRFLKNHAMSATRRYYHPELGFNFRMTNLQAAIGLAQLASASDLVARKRHIHARYRAALCRERGVHLQTVPTGHHHAPWLTAIVDDALAGEADRDAMMARLAERGIDSRPFFYPNHLMPAFAGGSGTHRPAKTTDPLPVTESISFRGFALPSGAGLSDAEVDRSIEAYLAERRPLA
jgi:perosamine synthetase